MDLLILLDKITWILLYPFSLVFIYIVYANVSVIYSGVMNLVRGYSDYISESTSEDIMLILTGIYGTIYGVGLISANFGYTWYVDLVNHVRNWLYSFSSSNEYTMFIKFIMFPHDLAYLSYEARCGGLDTCTPLFSFNNIEQVVIANTLTSLVITGLYALLYLVPLGILFFIMVIIIEGVFGKKFSIAFPILTLFAFNGLCAVLILIGIGISALIGYIIIHVYKSLLLKIIAKIIGAVILYYIIIKEHGNTIEKILKKLGLKREKIEIIKL